MKRLAELGGEEGREIIKSKPFYGYLYKTERNDSRLVQVAEELGDGEMIWVVIIVLILK